MGYLLATDGGGTKTEFRLCHLNGEYITSVITGASNYKSAGESGASENLREGFHAILKAAKITKDEIDYSIWGISGCDSRGDYYKISQIIQGLGLPCEKYEVCNDAVLGYYAQTDGPGMVAVAGTGSIIWGIDKDGKCCRKGGWGHLLSDGGSGYWIGRETLKRAILYCEECYPYSRLFDLIREQFHVCSFSELPAVLSEITDAYKIASAAKIVVDLSQQGNAEARKILEESAELLTDLIQSVYKLQRFEKESNINVVLSGGVLKSEEYTDILKREIDGRGFMKNVNYLRQINPPVQGGIHLAKKRITQA